MEIFKKIALLIFLVIIFLVISTALPRILASNTNGAQWYDSAHYLNEYYVADSQGNYDTGTGYQYYLVDSQSSPVAHSENLAYTGSSYYTSDYNMYSGDIYAQYENYDTGYQYYKSSKKYSYDVPDTGYEYYQEYENMDGFDDAWDEYVLNN